MDYPFELKNECGNQQPNYINIDNDTITLKRVSNESEKETNNNVVHDIVDVT